MSRRDTHDMPVNEVADEAIPAATRQDNNDAGEVAETADAKPAVLSEMEFFRKIFFQK